jgi:ferric iron reductase protein FhuF
MMRVKIILFALVLVLFGCSHRTAVILDDVETYIQERPDSALATLRAIDTTTLTTKKLQAHYALLHTMALDKNWIDTTDVNVVMPAVRYYDRHPSGDRRAKAWYYLGRIQENGGDFSSSIVSYAVAETASEKTEDEQFKGLLDMAVANIYRKVSAIDKQLKYTERSRDHFMLAGDTVHYNLSSGRLAMAYQEKKEWEKADSLYLLCLSLSGRDTAYMKIFLSQYAAMKVVQSDPDPEGAIRLLDTLRSSYGGILSLRDYGVLAFSYLMLGDFQKSERFLEVIDRQPENKRKRAEYLEYRIAEYRGEYRKALGLLESIYSRQDSTVYHLLDNSVTQALKDHYEREANETRRELFRNRAAATMVIVLLVVLIALIILWLNHRRAKEKLAADQLVRTAEETNRILKLTNTSLETEIDKLQSTFAQFYQSQLERIGSLCEAFLKVKDRGDEGKKEVVYRRVERIVDEINKDEESYARFELLVNKTLDNVVDHLKEDLAKGGRISKTDARFICYTTVGFDTNAIAMLLGLSISNVYTRRSRLKERIRQLESPYKEQYKLYIRWE